MIYFIFTGFFLLRLISLFISIKNEKKIKREGAIEYGKFNSTALTIVHIGFYFSCLFEAYNQRAHYNNISIYGTVLLIFAYTMLFYVIYELRKVWTLKIYIHPKHQIIQSFLFRWVKHPNYFLNIIPELFGIGLLCQAWQTLTFGLPVYLIILGIRIYQEEKAMKHLFHKKI